MSADCTYVFIALVSARGVHAKVRHEALDDVVCDSHHRADNKRRQSLTALWEARE